MRFVYLFILFVLLGLLGALPIAMIAALVAVTGGGTALFNIYWIAVSLLAAWLPLKALFDSRIKGQALDSILPKHVNGLAILFAGLAFIFMMPVLYVMNFMPLLLGILAYNFAGGNLAIGLAVGLIAEGISLYRMAVREKESGSVSNVFVRFNEINLGNDVFVQSEQVFRQEPRQYEPEILNLPETSLSGAYADEEVIYFDDEGNEEESSSH